MISDSLCWQIAKPISPVDFKRRVAVVFRKLGVVVLVWGALQDEAGPGALRSGALEAILLGQLAEAILLRDGILPGRVEERHLADLGQQGDLER